MSQIQPQKTTLPNGVRILLQHDESVRSAAVGLTCHTGSRHELEGEEGITHFIEHMLFKGTSKRTAKQIASSIEGRGGILNAFTDKEQTTYYCRVLSSEVPTALDVLSDMLLNCQMDPEEMEREKEVVFSEISRSEDEPSDYVHDLHIRSRWGEHELGKPIIGTKDSVGAFTRDSLLNYMARRYKGGQIILSIAGNFDNDAVLKQAEKQLSLFSAGSLPKSTSEPTPKVNSQYIGKEVEQVHFCIGGDSVPIGHEELYVAAVLDGVLGGGMSGRLFQELRERRGLAYSVGCYNLSYSTGGLFTIYGGTSAKQWQQVQDVTHAELEKIRRGEFEEGEVDRIKMQIAGSIVLSLEGMNSRMLAATKHEVHHGRHIPIDETLAKINAVTEQQIQSWAQKRLAPENLSMTVIGPKLA